MHEALQAVSRLTEPQARAIAARLARAAAKAAEAAALREAHALPSLHRKD